MRYVYVLVCAALIGCDGSGGGGSPHDVCAAGCDGGVDADGGSATDATPAATGDASATDGAPEVTDAAPDAAPDPCATLDCGAHGHCVAATASCACDDGYSQRDGACVSCPAWQDGQTVDVPAVRFSGKVTLNHRPPPAEAQLVLRDGVDSVPLNTHSTFDFRVVPGTYDVYTVSGNGSAGLPLNTQGLVRRGLAISRDVDVTIDVTAVHLRAVVRLAHRPLANEVTLVLKNGAGDLVRVDTDGRVDALVVPGTYDVYYANDGGPTPVNQLALLQRGVAIEHDVDLNFDIPSARLSGVVRLAGRPLNGQVTLVFQNDAGDSFRVDTDGHFDVPVVPGAWDVYYAQNGAGLPVNRLARLKHVAVDHDADLNFDVPVAALGAVVRVAHRPLNGPVTLIFRNDAGDGFQVDTDGHVDVPVVPGTWDVFYQRNGGGLPINTLAPVQRGLRVDRDVDLNFDVPQVTLRGVIRVGRRPVTGDVGLRLHRTDFPEDLVEVQTAGSGSFEVPIVPGTYDVFYAQGGDGTAYPRNREALLRAALAVNADVDLTFDVPSTRLRGHVTVGGRPLVGGLELIAGQSPPDRDPLDLDGADFDLPFVPGTYDLVYVHTDDRNPHNAEALLGCFRLGP
jgi:hypothetical protein